MQNPLGDPRPPEDTEAPPPSEDCLTLNVWRPSKPKHETETVGDDASAAEEDAVQRQAVTGLPVMVYVFGGGLCGGFAGNRYFNGSELAIHHNVIVVQHPFDSFAPHYFARDTVYRVAPVRAA